MLAMAVALLTTRIWMPDALVRNPRFCSANGVYCLVVREYANLPDNATAKAKVVVADTHPTERRATLYAKKKRVLRTRIAWPYGVIHVSDSGRFVVFRSHAQPVVAETPVLEVFSNGTVRTIAASEVFLPSDLDAVNREPFRLHSRLEGEQLVIDSVLRFDLSTATRLDALRDRYPSPRGWGTASQEVLARTVKRAHPEYVQIAQKARISGSVVVEASISPEGRVVSTRMLKPLPFGLDKAALEAANRWTFVAQPEEWIATLEFHFRWIDDEECRRVGCE